MQQPRFEDVLDAIDRLAEMREGFRRGVALVHPENVAPVNWMSLMQYVEQTRELEEATFGLVRAAFRVAQAQGGHHVGSDRD